MSTREQHNRSHILACALELFAARGYDAIGVQEICERASVTKPTLYHYFGSKRGLLDALVGERAAPLLADLREAAAYRGDLQGNLMRIARVSFQFAQREPTLYRLILGLWLVVPENEAFGVIVAFNQQQQGLVETMFEAAATDHGNMRGKHRVYATTYIGIVNTFVSLALNDYVQLDDVLITQAVRQFSYGIYT